MTNDFLMFIVTVKRDVSVLMSMHKNVCFKSMFKIFISSLSMFKFVKLLTYGLSREIHNFIQRNRRWNMGFLV